MRKGKLTLAALTVLTLATASLCTQARAGVGYSYVTDQTEYFAPPGGFVNVNIYLNETLTGGSASFIASDGGLLAYAVAIKQLASGTPIQPAPFIENEHPNVADFPVFAGNSFSMAQSGQLVGQIAFGGSGILPGNTGGGAAPSIPDEVYLGSISIFVPNTNYATFTVGAVDPIGGGNTLTKNNFYDLDTATNDVTGAPTNLFTGVGTSVSTFTVNFPEPGALGAFACCGGLLAIRRRRAAASHSIA